MVNRINLLLKAKNISARQFAEEIGIQPSGMSHILSGRNNPSLDFVMKVIRRYPEIDINWLMFGKGEMYEAHPRVAAYRTASPTPMATTPTKPAAAVQPPVAKQREAVQGDLFGQPVESGVNEMRRERNTGNENLVQSFYMSEATQAAVPQSVAQSSSVGGEAVAAVPAALQQESVATALNPQTAVGSNPVGVPSDTAGPQRKLVRLLAFYDDHIFVEYRLQ